MLTLAATCLLAGCSPSGPQVVRVTGRVTRGGQPVPNLTLNFMPAKGRPSSGLTDLDGNYTLTYTGKVAGALVGPHRVFVVFRGPAGPQAEQAMFRGQRPPSHPDAAAIKEKYGKLETTPLEVDIERDGQVVDLKLD